VLFALLAGSRKGAGMPIDRPAASVRIGQRNNLSRHAWQSLKHDPSMSGLLEVFSRSI
jgi:hypothetical protein